MAKTRLCHLDEVPDGGARVIDAARAGVPVVILRRGEHAWAYVNRCPHFSVPLDFEPGTVPCYRAQVVMCAHHSALFRFDDGHCIEGPCAGARLDALKIEIDDSAWIVLHR